MRVPSLLLAPLVVLTFSGAILIGQTWELPTMGQEFGAAASEEHRVEMIVQGLRCRGTSNFFMQQLANVPGLLSVSTFVQEHRAEIKFDPSQIDIVGIQRVIEAPVFLADGRIVQPFEVVEIKE
jgi:hypothetical protein